MSRLPALAGHAEAAMTRARAAEAQDDWFTAAMEWRNAAVFIRSAGKELAPELAELTSHPLDHITPARTIRRDHTTTDHLAGIADHHT